MSRGDAEARPLVRGIHTFQNGYFARNRELFEKLVSEGQRPEALFITCSDSRVVPNLITNAAPGDLFILRNIGNVVPRALPGGTTAAIEYAVEVLEVRDIIVCGHTHCGAMQAVLVPLAHGAATAGASLAEGDRARARHHRGALCVP